MDAEKNMEKYETYKSMHDNLNKAMKAEFYYQAIFIEYAIFEDRLTSLLKYAGVPYLTKKGKDLKISDKIKKAKTESPFNAPYVRKRIPIELLDQIWNWCDQRNTLVHHLATVPYDHDSVKQLAEKGKLLIKLFAPKAKSVNEYHKKKA